MALTAAVAACWSWIAYHGMLWETSVHAGFTAVVASALSLVAAWYLLRREVPVFPTSPLADLSTTATASDRDARLRHHARWFIHVRWAAVGISGTAVLATRAIGGVLPGETAVPLTACVGVLAVYNAVFDRWQRSRHWDPFRAISAQLVADVAVLTALLHFAGGLENPLYILYSFHVIITCILLGRREGYMLTLLACGLFGLMVVGEYVHVLHHYTVSFFPHVTGNGGHAAASGHGSHDGLYVFSRLSAFAGIMFGTAYFTSMIMSSLRANESHLLEMARTAASERQKLEGVIDAVNAGMIIFDPDLRVQWFNRQIVKWFGWREDQLDNELAPADAAGPDYDFTVVSRVLETGRTEEAEWVRSEEGGRRRYYRVIASPIQDERKGIVQVATLIQDVTAHKAAEAQMMHTERMAVIGGMAAGIAHEIGNPLSSLSTRLDLLEGRREEGFVRESVRLLKGQIERIRRIVQGVSQFSRYPKEEWAPCKVDQLVAETLEILQMDRRAKEVLIEGDPGDSLPVISGMRDRLSQVFLNIGINALEAMAGQGKLTVRTARRPGEVEVTFEDTGPGMSDDLQDRIFDPFFSTKEKGSGLGLYISSTIVNAHSGRIECDSKEGCGSVFRVILPANGNAVDV